MRLPVAGMLLIVVLSWSASVFAAENWTAFQSGQKINAEPGVLAEPKLEWQIPLTGYGQSSPVIWNDQVFITSVLGSQKEECVVTAYKLADGSQAWQQKYANPAPEELTSYVSKAAPSPVVDESCLIVLFEGGVLVSLSHKGDLLWQRDLVDEFGKIGSRHGLSSSLEQNAEHVFVWIERDADPYLMCVEKQSGKTIWKVKGLEATSWASPRLIPVGESQQLVLSGIGKLAGYDPTSGELLWEFTGIAGNSTPTPYPLGEGRFLIGATTGQGEGEEGRAAESNGVIAIKQDEQGNWSADFVWRARKATCSFGTPVASEDTAFFVNRAGIVFGLDLATGEEKFAVRGSGSTWATPLVGNGELIIFSKSGTIDRLNWKEEQPELTSFVLVNANPAAENPFAGPTLYAAVKQEKRILVRFGTDLVCLSW